MIRPEEPSFINKPLYKLITNGIRCIIICSNDLRSFLRDSLPLKLPKIHIGSYLRMEVTGSTAKKNRASAAWPFAPLHSTSFLQKQTFSMGTKEMFYIVQCHILSMKLLSGSALP